MKNYWSWRLILGLNSHQQAALSQNSQNWPAVKLDPKSVMMVLGKPNWYKMSQMKSTAWSGVSLVMGLYSIHLVNLSTTTSTWLNPLGATVKGPIMSKLQQANGHDGGIVIRLCARTWVFLPKNRQPGHHLTSSFASEIATTSCFKFVKVLMGPSFRSSQHGPTCHVGHKCF